MVTGKDLIDLATTRVGEEYVYGADVDLNDPDWHGPWDCAEFCSWVVNQKVGKLYGCLDADSDNPDPWTGAWASDCRNGRVKVISIQKATQTVGTILLRYRQGGHHIVFSTGDGGTVEAKSSAYGVCRGRVGSSESWDYGILIPEVQYD